MHYPILANALPKVKGEEQTMGKTLELVRKISKTEGFEEGKIIGETKG